MSPKDLHSWDLSPEAAVQVQAGLRQRLILVWDGRTVSTIGGVDVCFKESHARAAIVVLRYPDLLPLEGVTAVVPLASPYIPGLLAFREGPAFLAAWEALRVKPDLIMFDGQGIAHPRGIGIAAHLGLWLDRPSIGIAKSRLFGRHAEPGPGRGDRAPLYDEHDHRQVIGVVLRTREKVRPVYISPGHLIDIEHSAAFVMDCVTLYRLPEPTRLAHQVAGARLSQVCENRGFALMKGN
jgi:deoxyribonuclease V